MKKIFRLIAALAATTVAFSCMEEANPETPETGKTIYDGPVTTLEFTLDELETKTAWDGENHTWSEGDMIKIIWMDAEGKTGDVPAEVVEGKVTATVGVADTYYAVYPETTAYTLMKPQETTDGAEEAVINVTIPQTQKGSFKEANIMAAKTSSTERTLAFKNLTHIFKFSLSDDCEYTRMQFRSNQDVRINGTYDVAFGEDVTLTYNGNGKDTNSGYLYFNIPEGQKGPFYLAFEPNAKMEYGFGVSARRNATEGYIAGALTVAPIDMTRGVITNLGCDFDKHIINNWYIKENGRGDGSSWENAADISLLVKLLNKTQLDADKTHNGTTHEWRLSDAHIHVAAGTYDIQAANGNKNFTPNGLTAKTKVTIIGGYPADASEGAVPGKDETVFTTGNSVDNSRIFDFNGVNIGNLTFKGIQFKKAEANAVGLVNFREGVSGNVTFEDCVISVTTTKENSGAIRITPTDASKFTANFINCHFTENKGGFTTGGAMYCNGGVVNMTRCVFSENLAKNAADIYIETKTTFNINRCVFKNGTVTNKRPTSWAGAAITVNTNTNNQLNIHNSVFYDYLNPQATDAQPIILGLGSLLIANTSIYNNSVQVLRLAGGSQWLINNAIFNSRESISGGSVVQSTTRNGDYNLIQIGTSTNSNKKAEHDTDYGATNNAAISWSDDSNNFTWTLSNVSIPAANYAKKEEVDDLMKNNHATFDAWLKTIETDPYGIDYNGNERNPEKMNPGAWDPGL